MAKQEFLMPKMGESITEATILSWFKKVGESVSEDETLLEIATDKVDSELPSPFAGKVLELLYNEGDVVEVGLPIAIIETEGEDADSKENERDAVQKEKLTVEKLSPKKQPTGVAYSMPKITTSKPSSSSNVEVAARPSTSKRFYSPLVRSIAAIEQLTISDLDMIVGSGSGNRVTKADIVEYVRQRSVLADKNLINYSSSTQTQKSVTSYSGEVEIVEMGRMRKLIADHMVKSKQTSPHVTSFVEIDITNVVDWREKVKEAFLNKHKEKLTFTPIFIEAVSKAISDFPNINASVDGSQIVIKKYINIGMATATSSGNLIVPVIKNVNHMNLVGIASSVNDLATRARAGKLRPEEVQDGTFTLTNVGTFGNTMGTPIINQPQVAILSTGSIKKKPAVVEEGGKDIIGIRKFMFLSLSYDHRIVDGALGGQFLRRVGDYLENFDVQRPI